MHTRFTRMMINEWANKKTHKDDIEHILPGSDWSLILKIKALKSYRKKATLIYSESDGQVYHYFLELQKLYPLLRKRDYYSKHYSHYKKELKAKKELIIDSDWLAYFHSDTLTFLEKKLQLLRYLLQRIDQKISSDDFSVADLQNLESDFSSLQHPTSHFTKSEPPEYSVPPLSTKDFVDYAIRRLRSRLKKQFQPLKRDIRRCYRSLVVLIFKNMDDESGEANEIIQFLGFNKILPLYFFKDEQSNYYRTLKWNTGEIC